MRSGQSLREFLLAIECKNIRIYSLSNELMSKQIEEAIHPSAFHGCVHTLQQLQQSVLKTRKQSFPEFPQIYSGLIKTYIKLSMHM